MYRVLTVPSVAACVLARTVELVTSSLENVIVHLE